MNSKNLFLTSLLGAVLATTLFTAGCASSSKVTNTSDSVGKQLMDLDSAYQKGIITQDQYNKLKKEIIKRND